MLKKKLRILFAVAVLSFWSPLFAAKNSVVLSPSSGTISIGTACTVSVTSELPVDSVGLSLEYRSVNGTIHNKRLGAVSTSPYKMVVPIAAYGNQYFFGANLIAAVYRQDDTVQIVNSPRLFFLPEPISTRVLPFYPTSHSLPIPAGTDSISVTRESRGVTITFDIPVTGTVSDETLEPVTIVLDPRLTRTPFPGSNTVILSVPLTGESELITSAERTDSSMFTISRTGTPIHLKKQLELKDNHFKGTITVPDFLLGGKIRDTLGLNVIIPRPDGSGVPVSFVDGDMHFQYSPVLFPLFVKAELPGQAPVFPLKTFIGWLFTGIFLSAVLVLIRKTPKLSVQSLSEPGSDLIVLIEEHITNKDLSVEFLASKLNRSSRIIKREIKQVTGKSLNAYLEILRIEIVKERLALSNASEISIATDCGFKNVAAMEDAFHRLVGVAPYQFRKSHSV